MKRIGARGEGKFARISWDEALDKIAAELHRGSRKTTATRPSIIPYGTGSYNLTNGRRTAQRLLNLFGGSLGYYNSYSWACISAATPTVYGTNVTGNQRQDWLNSQAHPHVELEPGRDAGRDELRILHQEGQGARRPRRLPRSAEDPQRRGPGRRMGSRSGRARMRP